MCFPLAEGHGSLQGREWEIGSEMLAKALVCRTLDANKIQQAREKSGGFPSKESDMTGLQFWKLNLMSVRGME